LQRAPTHPASNPAFFGLIARASIAQKLTNRNIPSPHGGATWGQITVTRVMKQLAIDELTEAELIRQIRDEAQLLLEHHD